MYFPSMFNQIKHTLQQIFWAALAGACLAVNAQEPAPPQAAPTIDFTVVRILPHDPSHYTEGLLLHGGKLIESVGHYGRSALHELDLASGHSLKTILVPDRYFAEGIALSSGRLVQLTWREETALIYDAALRSVGFIHYDGEGWGLASTNIANELVMSDGSSDLRFVDASDLRTKRKIRVHDGPREIYRLNELEYADGSIYANIWLTDQIARIDPHDGRVIGWLDLSKLRQHFTPPPGWNEVDDVPNGIAYDPASGHFYVTGKCWPALFEIAIKK